MVAKDKCRSSGPLKDLQTSFWGWSYPKLSVYRIGCLRSVVSTGVVDDARVGGGGDRNKRRLASVLIDGGAEREDHIAVYLAIHKNI